MTSQHTKQQRIKTRVKKLLKIKTMKKYVKKIDDALYGLSALGFLAVFAAVMAVVYLVCGMVTAWVNYAVWGITMR